MRSSLTHIYSAISAAMVPTLMLNFTEYIQKLASIQEKLVSIQEKIKPGYGCGLSFYETNIMSIHTSLNSILKKYLLQIKKSNHESCDVTTVQNEKIMVELDVIDLSDNILGSHKDSVKYLSELATIFSKYRRLEQMNDLVFAYAILIDLLVDAFSKILHPDDSDSDSDDDLFDEMQVFVNTLWSLVLTATIPTLASNIDPKKKDCKV